MRFSARLSSSLAYKWWVTIVHGNEHAINLVQSEAMSDTRDGECPLRAIDQHPSQISRLAAHQAGHSLRFEPGCKPA